MKELLEIQARRREEKRQLLNQSVDFMNRNIGHLTGTYAGAKDMHHSKVSITQVRKDLADPKAAPKPERGSQKKNNLVRNSTNDLIASADKRTNYSMVEDQTQELLNSRNDVSK